MKIFCFLTFALLVGVGVFFGYAQLTKHRLPPKAVVAALAVPLKAAPAPPVAGGSLGLGLVVTSRSYKLVAQTRGRVKRIFFERGRHVRRGEILLKFYDHTFLVAPADGVITERLVEASEYVPLAAPIALFTEVYPFRIKLPLKAIPSSLAPGQVLQIQSVQHPAQAVTGVVVTSVVDSQSVFVNLRLRTLGLEPVPVGSQVHVDFSPPTL